MINIAVDDTLESRDVFSIKLYEISIKLEVYGSSTHPRCHLMPHVKVRRPVPLAHNICSVGLNSERIVPRTTLVPTPRSQDSHAGIV